MKLLVYLNVFVIYCILVFSSCKNAESKINNNGAAKININDVEAHRAYQDTLLSRTKSNSERIRNLPLLIAEYKSIERNELQENLNVYYYLARLYNLIHRTPYLHEVFDSANLKTLDSIKYINYTDSARFYSKKVIDKSPDNIRAFNIYCTGFYWEWMIYMQSKNTAPFIGVRSNEEYNNQLMYISENALKYRGIDTTKNKQLSQEIIECACFFIVVGILNNDFENVDYGNKNNLKLLSLLGSFVNELDKSDVFYILNKDMYLKSKYSLEKISNTAKIKLEEINKKELEEAEIAKNTIVINHDGSKDWDQNRTMAKVGEEVWAACRNYPNAIKLIVNITDKCKDSYGKETLITSSFTVLQSEMAEYRKYQDASSFNRNCFEWGSKLLTEYKPCGRSQLGY